MSHELNVTIKQLKALVAVYKSGSFTSAAEALHVTQSALSVLIKDLELNIGTRLFNRTSRRVEPTQSGRQLIMAANRMLSELECAVRNARDAQSGTQQLILGCPPMAAATFVPEIIAAVRTRAPNLRVVVRDIRPDEIAEATIAGELDLGLGSFGEPPSPLARSVIAHQDLVLIASPKNPLSSRKLVTWSDLRGAPLIQIAGDTTTRDAIHGATDLLQTSGPPAFEVFHAMSVVALVSANLGVAVLPSWVVCARSRYDFAVRTVEEPRITSDLSVVYHSDRAYSAPMQLFTDALQGYFASISRS